MTGNRKLDRQVAAADAKASRTLKQLYALSEALLRSEVVLGYFLDEMAKLYAGGLDDQELARESAEKIKILEISRALRVGSLMALHLSSLYAVVEKWSTWKFADPRVDSLLESPYVRKLRKYRHTIFHADLLESKDRLSFSEDLAITGWARDLTEALHAALADWHADTDARLREHLLRNGW